MRRGQQAKVVVITGASAGVGRATVRRFAEDRAWIGLIARGRDGLEAARRDVEAVGGRALVLPTDVADAAAVESAASQVEEVFGPIDIWINNAMTSVFSPVKWLRAEEVRRVTEVTYLGSVYGTLSALRRMLPRNRGTIVQVGSALAYRSIPLQAAYCGAKHAIKGFTEALWCELIHDRSRVHVAMVHLPAINTPQFGWVKSRMPRHPQPVPPIYHPEVAAEAVYWAAHHRRREFTVGARAVQAILGEKVIPRVLDHYLAAKGYEAQQTDWPVDPERRDNLWEPVPGDAGAHGLFDDQSRAHSLQLWANLHAHWLLPVAAGFFTVWMWRALTSFRPRERRH
jgi:short-subunit dehydrogenase